MKYLIMSIDAASKIYKSDWIAIVFGLLLMKCDSQGRI